MITRIVRMSFIPEKVRDFREIFEVSKIKIQEFEGCTDLKLHRDMDHPDIFYTISHWESKDHLEAYRKSTLFKSTWARVKPMFKDAPKAYSLDDPDQ